MEIRLPESERRWLHAVLVLGTFVLALVLMSQVATILVYFSDLLLILLLAWLLAFMISPLLGMVLRAAPRIPRVVVVGGIYALIFLIVSSVTLLAASSLANSIGNFINQLPAFQARLPQLIAPLEDWLAAIGIQLNLVAIAQDGLAFVASLGDDLVGPLTNLALASIGVLFNLLIVVFLSLFMLLEKDRLIAYFNRLVPPRYGDEARLFETSVAASFGGFVRGQFIQGLIYFAWAAVTHVIFGLDFLVASAAAAGVLQAIPFFGPFISWAPPVAVALLTKPEVALPVLIVMGIGWFIVMNIVQPRVMATAVGINPVAVLISVLVGVKIAGVAGAIFALPFAAVMAAFFHHFLERSAGDEPRDVATRAARRVEQREGRRVRVPTAPSVGEAAEGSPTATDVAAPPATDQAPASGSAGPVT